MAGEGRTHPAHIGGRRSPGTHPGWKAPQRSTRRPMQPPDGGWVDFPAPASAPRGARLCPEGRGGTSGSTAPGRPSRTTSPDGRGSSLARYRPAPLSTVPLPLQPRHQVQAVTGGRRHSLEQVRGGGGVSFHGFQSLEDPPADDRVGVLHIAHVPHQLASALVCDCRSWAHARPDTARGAQPRAVVAPAGTWVSTALGLCVAALQTSVWT